MLHGAFSSAPIGDHIMVDVALSVHCELLQEAGVLRPDRRVLGRRALPDAVAVEGLVIDDCFIAEKVPIATDRAPLSEAAYSAAQAAYRREQLPGSTSKDYLGEATGTVCGAEVDSRVGLAAARETYVAAPLERRLVLSHLSLEAARLPIISGNLAATLAGCWGSMFSFRRPLMVVLNEIYSLAVEPFSDIRTLPRTAADELVLAAVLAPLAVTGVTAPVLTELAALDASLRRGAVVVAKAPEAVNRSLWRFGEARGGYSRRELPTRALRRSLGPLPEEDEDSAFRDGGLALGGSARSLAMFYEVIEVGGGSGGLSSACARLGLICGPVLDHSCRTRAGTICDGTAWPIGSSG